VLNRDILKLQTQRLDREYDASLRALGSRRASTRSAEERVRERERSFWQEVARLSASDTSTGAGRSPSGSIHEAHRMLSAAHGELRVALGALRDAEGKTARAAEMRDSYHALRAAHARREHSLKESKASDDLGDLIGGIRTALVRQRAHAGVARRPEHSSPQGPQDDRLAYGHDVSAGAHIAGRTQQLEGVSHAGRSEAGPLAPPGALSSIQSVTVTHAASATSLSFECVHVGGHSPISVTLSTSGEKGVVVQICASSAESREQLMMGRARLVERLGSIGIITASVSISDRRTGASLPEPGGMRRRRRRHTEGDDEALVA